MSARGNQQRACPLGTTALCVPPVTGTAIVPADNPRRVTTSSRCSHLTRLTFPGASGADKPRRAAGRTGSGFTLAGNKPMAGGVCAPHTAHRHAPRCAADRHGQAPATGHPAKRAATLGPRGAGLGGGHQKHKPTYRLMTRCQPRWQLPSRGRSLPADTPAGPPAPHSPLRTPAQPPWQKQLLATAVEEQTGRGWG